MRRRKGTGRKLQSSLYGQMVWSLFVWGKARHRNHFFFAISDALWIFSCLHGAADARDDSNKSSCKRLTKDAVHQHLHTSRWKPPLFNGGGGFALNHAFCFFLVKTKVGAEQHVFAFWLDTSKSYANTWQQSQVRRACRGKKKIFFLGVALLAVFHSLSSRRHGEWRWTIHNRLRLRLRLPKPILYGQSQTSAVRQIQLRSLDCWPVCWHNFLTTQVCMWRMWCAQSAHIPTPGPLCWMFFYLPCTWLGPNYMSESKFCEHIPCCVVSAVSLVAISCLIQAANKTTQIGKRYAIWFFNLILGWILHTSLPATARVGHGPWPWLLVLSL